MKRTLHILKDSDSSEALTLITQQALSGSETFQILLIQEAVRLTPSAAVPTYVLENDLKAKGVLSPFQTVNYEGMLEMIFTTDTVMTW